MKCKICGKNSRKLFSAKIIKKYNIDYFHCESCDFIQTEEPYWLNEAYNSPINLSDTGLVQRNFYLTKKVSVLIYFIFNQSEKYIDYAGGYGLFTRLMRDIGFNFYHYDPFTENLFARGFESNNLEKYSALTTFETFEHFVNPLQEIEKMLKYSSNIIFTTELLPYDLSKPENWWYFGFEHGQHVSFYSTKTLSMVARLFNKTFLTNGKIHLFTDVNISVRYFEILLKLEKLGLYNFVKRKVISKTQEDSYALCLKLGEKP